MAREDSAWQHNASLPDEKNHERAGVERISAQVMMILETPLRYEMGPTFRLSEPTKSKASGPILHEQDRKLENEIKLHIRRKT